MTKLISKLEFFNIVIFIAFILDPMILLCSLYEWLEEVYNLSRDIAIVNAQITALDHTEKLTSPESSESIMKMLHEIWKTSINNTKRVM